MAGPHDALARTASELVRRNGRPVTLRQKVNYQPDPATPWRPDTPTETTYDVYCTFEDLALTERPSIRIQGGAQLGQGAEAGDQKGMIAALDLATEPAVGDEVVDGGRAWRVMDVAIIKPGVTAIAYLLHLRG